MFTDGVKFHTSVCNRFIKNAKSSMKYVYGLLLLRTQTALSDRCSATYIPVYACSRQLSVCLLELSHSDRHVYTCFAALCRADCAVLYLR